MDKKERSSTKVPDLFVMATRQVPEDKSTDLCLHKRMCIWMMAFTDRSSERDSQSVSRLCDGDEENSSLWLLVFVQQVVLNKGVVFNPLVAVVGGMEVALCINKTIG